MVPLLAAVDPAAAAGHLHRHLDLCLAGGGEPRPAWRFDEARTRWHPCEDPRPGWSRGRAWLLLAVADAMLRPEVAAHEPDRLTAAARRLLALDGVLTGPLVPPDAAGAPAARWTPPPPPSPRWPSSSSPGCPRTGRAPARTGGWRS
ncbi:hypothetical protein ACRAR1_25965 [Streptomyces sanyensis]|uniref:hypothetical protein n=1 Tax=Streptomyces sanyensis TaxID=568869 RepID=UPI003D77D175